MSAVLDHTSPIQRFFEEISAIPRETEHEEAISDYVLAFARERELYCRRDELWNVVVKKPASPGCEAAAPLILQAHMDMVCDKALGSTHDFAKDPIQLVLEGNRLRAKDTSLGADDGFGVAYILAVLDDPDLKHPALECIFTTQEEHKTMVGAEKFDACDITAKRMIGLDGDGETATYVACACSDEVRAKKRLDWEPFSGCALGLEVIKAEGNNIGGVTHLECRNAVKMVVRLLQEVISAGYDIRLCALDGGTSENRSPKDCRAVFACRREEEEEAIRALLEKEFASMADEFLIGDFSAELVLQEKGSPGQMLTASCTGSILDLVYLLPNNQFQADVVKNEMMSINTLGIASMGKEYFELVMSSRSLKAAPEKELVRHILRLCERCGFEAQASVRYFPWKYDPESPLRRLANQVYLQHTGKTLEEVTCPGGLEIGWMSEKIPGLDAIMLGPIHENVHTKDEFMEIDSFERVYTYLLKIIEKMAQPEG